jgi:hypothetical protein
MLARARRPIAAIAVFAILFNAFASAVAAARLPAPSGEICTSRIAVAGALDEPAPAGGYANNAHCPYCAPHAGSFAAPPPAALRVRAPAQAAPHASAAAHAPALRAEWSAAQPRAPPRFG